MTDTIPSALDARMFGEFFEALWGNRPFAWQSDLAARVLSDPEGLPQSPSTEDPSEDARQASGSSWPEAIALPTASGKTACMDIAVFGLAAQAVRLAKGQVITAPRRIFFVVDRRVIVDEAYERARRLADKLAAATDGVVKTVKDNLLCIGRGQSNRTVTEADERPLSVHALRGGMYRSESWAHNPLQPTIVASTVDQVGSRLLFRAYGRGSGTWPIYAGLIANDSLILLDEAHCSQPFLQTLQAVRRYRTWASTPLQRCFFPVVMSATPPSGLRDVFEDTSDEGTDKTHALGRRQLAEKPARLDEVANAKGARVTDIFSKELAEAALGLLGNGRQTVVVFVNRVATARQTYRLLRSSDVDALLLTGRMRALDKDVVVERLKQFSLHSDQSPERELRRPVVVVATQTLEVGADLDFDGLVTECASLDSLRQRFGRLNRLGRCVESRARILIRSDQVKPKQDDPVYGKALAETWAWLQEVKDEKEQVDFGIAAFGRIQPEHGRLARLNAPALSAPVMLPTHVDYWSQTAPQPQPSPDVALFLHGPHEGAPDVQVCWRADLDLSTERGQHDALESLALCPPSSSEMLPVPVGVFRRWLSGDEAEDDSSDVEGIAPGSETRGDVWSSAERTVVRWRGRDTELDAVTAEPTDIRPGDGVVVPTAHPGRWSDLGDLPLDTSGLAAALDVGDQAHLRARAKAVLRLHSDLIDVWPDSMVGKRLAKSLLDTVGDKHEEDPAEVAADLRTLLMVVADADAAGDCPEWLRRTATALGREHDTPAKLRRAYRLIGERNLILLGRRRIETPIDEVDAFGDEDDVASSGISHRRGKPVRLRTHLPGVEDFARGHAVGFGLPEDLADAVARAGLLHDVGKADPRFQSLLKGTRWVGGELLAKSAEIAMTPAARRRARENCGYPDGWRHELLSVRMAETAPGLLPSEPELRDLVLHLVASHHGHCRPFAPVVIDRNPAVAEFSIDGHEMRWSCPTGMERLDSGVADRFWRLTRRYGWWGLAWLEALLRLADWRRSEWEETHDVE